MSHTCHAHGCNRPVPPSMWGCRTHWFSLPKAVRDAVWREYRSGQEVDKRPSPRYLAVQRIAVMHTAFKPNDEGAARICAEYLREAIEFQQKSIALGLGDPLVGLVPRSKGEKT